MSDSGRSENAKSKTKKTKSVPFALPRRIFVYKIIPNIKPKATNKNGRKLIRGKLSGFAALSDVERFFAIAVEAAKKLFRLQSVARFEFFGAQFFKKSIRI